MRFGEAEPREADMVQIPAPFQTGQTLKWTSPLANGSTAILMVQIQDMVWAAGEWDETETWYAVGTVVRSHGYPNREGDTVTVNVSGATLA